MTFRDMPRQRRERRGVAALLLGVSLGVLGACDSLLEVDLPAQLTDDALANPTSAETQVNSAIAIFECGYSAMVWRHLGNEDVFESIAGVASGAHVYAGTAPGGGDCDTDSEDGSWFGQMTSSRALAAGVYDRIETDWADVTIANRQRLLAQAALYAAAPIDVLGEFMCEMAIDAGPLMTPQETLAYGEQWIETALGHIAQAGNFELPFGITGPADGMGAEEMAYALRARMRWAKGDATGALADLARVPDGFTAYVTRDGGLTRRNKVYDAGTAVGFSGMLDVNTWWVGPPNPATGQAYPNPIPFTGYLFLGVLPDGRAVTDAGLPIRTTVDVAAVADPRVPHFMKSIQGPEPRHVPDKYKSDDEDIPLVSWRELKLIEAELLGGQPAIDLVNELRDVAGLPRVTYLSAGDATGIERMIFEERRRELFAEGRFLATKILNPEHFWFPRLTGATPFQGYGYGGAVRFLLPQDEYEQNTNLTLDDRATGCPASQAPVY